MSEAGMSTGPCPSEMYEALLASWKTARLEAGFDRSATDREAEEMLTAFNAAMTEEMWSWRD